MVFTKYWTTVTFAAKVRPRCWKREYLLRKAEGFKADKSCSIDPRYLMREADLSQYTEESRGG